MKTKFVKYIFSRFGYAFLLVFFLHWIFNIHTDFIGTVAMVIIGLIGFVSIILFFIFINRNEPVGDNETLLSLFKKLDEIDTSKSKFSNYLKVIFSLDFLQAIFHIEYKVERKRYEILFIILLAISIWVFKGNPIINNYYGLYKTVEVEMRYNVSNREYDKIIVPKNLAYEAKRNIERNCKNYEECDVKMRGYIFVEAGIFHGFKPLNNNYSFFSCFFFVILERLIHTLMYFMLPFLIGIYIIDKSKSKINS